MSVPPIHNFSLPSRTLIISPQATYIRLVYSIIGSVPQSCLRTLNGTAAYSVYGWPPPTGNFETPVYLVTITLANLASFVVLLAAASITTGLPRFDPTNPVSLTLAAEVHVGSSGDPRVALSGPISDVRVSYRPRIAREKPEEVTTPKADVPHRLQVSYSLLTRQWTIIQRVTLRRMSSSHRSKSMVYMVSCFLCDRPLACYCSSVFYSHRTSRCNLLVHV